MIKKMVYLVTILLSLQLHSMQVCDDLSLYEIDIEEKDQDLTEEELLRGQKCACFCSLSIEGDENVANLTVNGDVTTQNVVGESLIVDGQVFLNGQILGANFVTETLGLAQDTVVTRCAGTYVPKVVKPGKTIPFQNAGQSVVNANNQLVAITLGSQGSIQVAFGPAANAACPGTGCSPDGKLFGHLVPSGSATATITVYIAESDAQIGVLDPVLGPIFGTYLVKASKTSQPGAPVVITCNQLIPNTFRLVNAGSNNITVTSACAVVTVPVFGCTCKIGS